MYTHCCVVCSFRHLRFVSKEALLASDLLPMSPNDFKMYVKERCKELNHILQRRSLLSPPYLLLQNSDARVSECVQAGS